MAGIGFTVSLLISSLAFEGQQLEEAKLGVLAAALPRRCWRWGVFRVIRRLPAEVRARQIAGTAEELLDLSDEVDPERDHIRGSEEAPVTLRRVRRLRVPVLRPGGEPSSASCSTRSATTLRYVWRHLPLNDVHPNAQMAAEAAEAAAAQGGFWEMNDKLLDHQDELTPPDLTRYAEELGLDVERFWDELAAARYAARVAEDVASADASGVAGTPELLHQRQAPPGRLRHRHAHPGRGEGQAHGAAAQQGPRSARGRAGAVGVGSPHRRPEEGSMELEGKVALITGASAGIGASVARKLHDAGASVGLLSRHGDDLGPRAWARASPATSATAAPSQNATKAVLDRFGRLDIVVANAGVGSYGPFLDLDPDQVEAMIDMNLKGTLYTAATTFPT